MAQVRGLWAEACLSPLLWELYICKGQTPSSALVLTEPVACSHFSPWLEADKDLRADAEQEKIE